MSSARHAPRLRIGIDTGGTFTDVVCVDSGSGAMRVTKVASTPANPAIGLVRGVQAILQATGEAAHAVAGLAHGTTVATNVLLQGPIMGLGLVVTLGFRHLLEIARQSVPEGYGNSYFWVKPDRIVPLHLVRAAQVGQRPDGDRGRVLGALTALPHDADVHLVPDLAMDHDLVEQRAQQCFFL